MQGAQKLELVPGREAVRVEMSSEELDALTTIMLKAGNNRRTGEYSKRLEAEGVTFEQYRTILARVAGAEQMLAVART